MCVCVCVCVCVFVCVCVRVIEALRKWAPSLPFSPIPSVLSSLPSPLAKYVSVISVFTMAYFC